MSLQGGTYGNKRFTTDLDQPLNDKVAFRLNGVFEDSDSFRHDVGLKRYGITPTITFAPGANTRIIASYEYLNDRRVADEASPRFRGGLSMSIPPRTTGIPRTVTSRPT